MCAARVLQVGGYVLAGGKSSRMGTDKALVELAGRPLIARAVEKLRQICAEVHILSSNPELEVHAPLIGDLHEDCGPIGGIEAALAQKKVGESCSVLLEPEDAFGEYDADLVRVEPQDRFPPEIKIGMQFEGYAGSEETNGGDDEGQVFTVTDIADGKVVVDGNHPLAGQRLRFDCTVLDIRPATSEEMAHGHVHAPDGHHH